MAASQYGFEQFLKRIEDMAYPQMLAETQREGAQAERKSCGGGKYGADARANGSLEYTHSLGGLGFFLLHGHRPVSISAEEFQLYKPLCLKLIAKKQMLPSVLDLFDPAKVS